jgi:2-succinyl-5-enolpyruvyl-6-hydroxy-3-cyclohexene-1-carboxylate synthase
MTGGAQTLWAELAAATLADAGVRTCVISPGSRSTPLVAALAADGRLDLPSIIDERAAAFFALGAARATGRAAAVVCTNGSAAAHYFPAIVEASAAGIPLVAITADRPPELQQCGATQTIDQVKLYGDFVRGAFDLGAPVASAPALRAVRRKLVQAATLARGPHPGPVHILAPLRKPLEPALPHGDAEQALAAVVAELRATRVVAEPPRLAPDATALTTLAAAIAAEPRGLVVAGALAAGCEALRELVFALCARTRYPLLAEAGSQLRFGPRPRGVIGVDPFDVVLAAPPHARPPAPRLILQLGAEPVAAGWATGQAWLADASRWVLAEATWRDPESSARGVVLGDLELSLAALVRDVQPSRADEAFERGWCSAAERAQTAIDRALAAHPRSESAAVRAAIDALPSDAVVQIGNSQPIRTVDLVSRSGGASHVVLTQRGAAGIDGLVASAAGATRAGRPVLLVLGDVSFAHDVGGLLAARESCGPLAILVIDNGGGRIFDGLPVARAQLGAAYERHFVTAPRLDPIAVATAFGARAVAAGTPDAVGAAVAAALATDATTVIHAACSASGAHDVRRLALELAIAGGSHA